MRTVHPLHHTSLVMQRSGNENDSHNKTQQPYGERVGKLQASAASIHLIH